MKHFTILAVALILIVASFFVGRHSVSQSIDKKMFIDSTRMAADLCMFNAYFCVRNGRYFSKYWSEFKALPVNWNPRDIKPDNEI